MRDGNYRALRRRLLKAEEQTKSMVVVARSVPLALLIGGDETALWLYNDILVCLTDLAEHCPHRRPPCESCIQASEAVQAAWARFEARFDEITPPGTSTQLRG